MVNLTDLGKANREVCNVVIVDYATDKPFLNFKYSNTTGVDITSDSVSAMAHGAKKITFNNPLDGKLTISAQVLPLKMYAMYSDGIIDKDATYYQTATVACTTDGEIPLTVSDGTIVTGTVFVYNEGDFGNEAIEGTFASDKFTAKNSSDIKQGKSYEVGFMVSRTNGVQKITLNNKRYPRDVAIYMDTIYKDENGNYIPYRINIKKATMDRNMNLSYSSEGDPQSMDMTFNLLEKNSDEFVEIVEITDDITINPVP